MKSLRIHIIYILIVFFCQNITHGQANILKLQNERKKLVSQISTIRKMLSSTTQKTKENIEKINVINKQIEVNNLLIANIDEEITEIQREIDQKQESISELFIDLDKLKKEYAKIIYIGYKATHGVDQLVYIFSSPSFHQLAERLRYVRQYAKFRKKHFEEIKRVYFNLNKQKKASEQYKNLRTELLTLKKSEVSKLLNLKTKHNTLVQTLYHDQENLKKELKKQNESIASLDTLIKEVIAQSEREKIAEQKNKEKNEKNDIKDKKSTINKKELKIKVKESPKQKLPPTDISNDFAKQKGNLIWPVNNGVIVRKFGIWPHPVLPGIKMENLGITIQTQPKAKVKAIFAGTIKGIAHVPGMEKVVIIQHGRYHTVYAKLDQIYVKSGQKVNQGDTIGIVYTKDSGHAELQLQIWENTNRLNPQHWLR
jgi:septal ring factor EnvC (AmiA/AmiB activator)